MKWLGLAWALAALQAAEKLETSTQSDNGHPSAAKAVINPVDLSARSKTRHIPCRMHGDISVAPPGLSVFLWPFPGLRFACPGLFSFGPSGADAAEAFSSHWVSRRLMRTRVNSCPFKTLLAMTFFAACLALPAQGDGGSVLKMDFSNPGLTPSKWTLVLHADGSAHFHADSGALTAAQLHVMEPTAVDRDVQLSQQFADRVFDTVHHHNLLNEGCESHLKVAFQGWKKMTYSGPDGDGSCEFNYSKNKDIQSLGESLVAVAGTIIEGARLELLLQHDPLGLDKEMEYLKEASNDGRLQQMCAIHGILTRLVDDPEVMERVRRRARLLLAESSK